MMIVCDGDGEGILVLENGTYPVGECGTGSKPVEVLVLSWTRKRKKGFSYIGQDIIRHIIIVATTSVMTAYLH